MMRDDWWDTEAYWKRFVPYYQMLAALLLEWYQTRPKHRKNILQSWYNLGEDIDREYQFRVRNGYDTDEIEQCIEYYNQGCEVIAGLVDDGTERAVSDTQ